MWLLIVFAALRVVAAAHNPMSAPDTVTYLQLSFLGGAERPWTVPLLWWVVRADGLREAVQIAFGVVAWSVLAVSLGRSVATEWVRVLAVAVVLALGLVPEVAGWDGTLLSESISISLLVLLIGLLLAVTRRSSPLRLAACLLVALLWVFARQTNTLLFLGLLPLTVAFALLRLPRRQAVGVAVALVAIGAWSAYVLTRPAAGGPWKENAVSILVYRISTDRAAARFFEQRGAPGLAVNAIHLRALGNTESQLLANARVMDWVDHHFRATYFAYLERNLGTAIATPLTTAPEYLTAEAPDASARRVLPSVATDVLWASPEALMIAEWVLALVLVAAAVRYGRSLRSVPVIVLLGVGAVLVSVIVLDTATGDLARLLLPGLLCMHLVAIVAGVLATDALLVGADRSRLERLWAWLGVVPPTGGSLWKRVEPGSMRLTAGILFATSLVMAYWESSVVGSLRLGRLGLLAAAAALAYETDGLRTIWKRRDRLLRGPAIVIAIAGALLVTLVLVSSRTNGCQCAGGSYGVAELAIWTALAFLVVSISPDRAIVLLGGAALGSLIAGLVALAHPTVPSAGSGGDRLAGSYGNANYFAATQAFGLPLGIGAVVLARSWRLRLTALAGCAVLAGALLLSYSRSGILAAGAGALVAVVLLVPPRRRLAVGAGMVAVAAIGGLLVYPAFKSSRTSADFSYRLSVAQTTDASGWRRSITGLIGGATSQMRNVSPDILSVEVPPQGGGVSFPIGDTAPQAVKLSFQARAPGGPVALRYGMEDNYTGDGPVHTAAAVSSGWRSLSVTWTPPAAAPHARIYFWSKSRAAFELRSITVSGSSPPRTRAIPTRLLDRTDNIRAKLAQRERAYINEREVAARVAWHAFLNHPVFGIGWERFPSYIDTRAHLGPIASHDEYLRFAAELGLPGLLSLLCLIGGIVWAAIRARSTRWGAAAIGLLVAGAIELAFSNILSAPDVALPLASAAAVVAALASGDRKPASNQGIAAE